jgi:hypothetical protein
MIERTQHRINSSLREDAAPEGGQAKASKWRGLALGASQWTKKRNQCENLIAGLFANSQETDQQRQLCNQYSISSMGIFSLF